MAKSVRIEELKRERDELLERKRQRVEEAERLGIAKSAVLILRYLGEYPSSGIGVECREGDLVIWGNDAYTPTEGRIDVGAERVFFFTAGVGIGAFAPGPWLTPFFHLVDLAELYREDEEAAALAQEIEALRGAFPTEPAGVADGTVATGCQCEECWESEQLRVASRSA